MTEQSTRIPGALNREAIVRLISGEPPVLVDFVDLDRQLQPNGFDLTVRTVAGYAVDATVGSMGVADSDRVLPNLACEPFAADGWIWLAPGPHLITFNEAVNLPLWLMALVRPRSSLLRSGVAIHTAVWDAGYAGRSQALLNVYHPGGYRLQQNARVAQMIFIALAEADYDGYTGRYQRENL